MASSIKYLGIRFPFTSKDIEGFFIDADYNPYKEIKSDIMHLLFTPKGQRLRNPSFGSDLIKYVFEPNDSKTMTDIKLEMQEMLKKYFPGITITQLEVTRSDADMHRAEITLKYEINEGAFITEDEIKTTL